MSKRRSAAGIQMAHRVQVGFGSRLKSSRKSAPKGRVKQDVLAEALEISRTSISNIECGNHRIFLDQVYAAARALGVEVAALLPTMDEVFPPAVVSTGGQIPKNQLRQISVEDLMHRAIREAATNDEVSSPAAVSTGGEIPRSQLRQISVEGLTDRAVREATASPDRDTKPAKRRDR